MDVQKVSTYVCLYCQYIFTLVGGYKLFPKRQILDTSKLKEFADDNFEFHENGRELTRWVEKYCGKRRNCSLRAISPIPTVFSKDFYC